MNNLSNILIDFIETNKVKYGIDYKASIENLKELLEEIEQEYENIEEEI